MSDVIETIHRFNYEVQGQQNLSQVQQILQQQVQTIGQNTASLKRLEQALASTTNPQLQQRIQQAIQNRRNAIAAENQSIANMLRSNTTLQNSMRSEIGIINELTGRLNQLRTARDRATSTDELMKYNRRIRDLEKEQGQFMQQGLNGGGSVLGSVGSALGQGLGIGAGLGIFSALQNGVGFVKDFATESFKAAANFDQLKVAFSTMLQSEPKANKLLQDIVAFAANTPYGVEQLTDLSKQLLAYGFQAEEIIPTLDMLGNVAAGVGKDKMPQIILAFGQIRAAGKLAGQDLLQLINAGFNPLQVISEKTGESMTSLKTKMEKGAISFQMVKDAFKTATTEGGKFFNLMQNQTNTVAGQMDRLEDSVQQLMVAFGNLLQDTGSDLIGMFSGIVESITDLIKLNPAEEVRKEQEAFNGLIFALKSANEDEKLRSAIISEITQKYPEFIRLVDLETASNEQLSQAVAEVNRQLQQKINLAALSARSDKLAARGTEIQQEYVEYLVKIGRVLARDGVIKDASQIAAMSDEEINKLSRDLPNSVVESLNRFKQLRRENQKERQENQNILQAEESRQRAADAATLKAAKDKLALLKKQGAAQSDITAQERFIAGLEYVEPKAAQTNTSSSSSTTVERKSQSKKDLYQSAQEANKQAADAARYADEQLKSIDQIRQGLDQEIIEKAKSNAMSKEALKIKQEEVRRQKELLNLREQQRKIDLEIDAVNQQLITAQNFNKQDDILRLNDQLGTLQSSAIEIDAAVQVKIVEIGGVSLTLPSEEDLQNKVNEEISEALREGSTQSGRARNSLGIKKGIITQELVDAYVDSFKTIEAAAVSFANNLLQAQINALDKEIEYRKYAVSQAEELAKRGNTTILKEEEDRLQKTLKAREDAERKQQILNAVANAANIALATTQSIVAITKTAATSGVASVGTVPLTLAAIVADIAGVVASLSGIGFKDGVIDLQGPGTTTSDSIPARLSRGESVINAKATEMYKPYLESMNAMDFNIYDHLPSPVVYLPKAPKNVPSSDGYVSKQDFKMLGKKLDEVTEAVSGIRLSANQKMDKNGLAQSVEAYIEKEKKRFK